MAQQAAVLILAELDEGPQAELVSACSAVGFSATVEPSAEAAVGRLAARKCEAFLVHMGTPGAALACMKARGKLLRMRVPILALVDDEDDATFARAYRAGADEVIGIGRSASISARLRALPKLGMPQPGHARGDAVVADPDRNRGEVLDRVLRDAGFRVEVAVDSFAARLQAGRPSLKVAILDASLDDAAALIAQARAKGSRCAWVVRARPELIDELREKLGRMERVSVVSAYGPPDDVLFETNRLLEARPHDGRADARHLHGTIVRLKWKQDGSDDIAYTYNVSSVGLFIRTLAAPVGDELSMEVVPPTGTAPLHLEGKVVWRREFGTTRKEAVPPGFGVRVTAGDLGEWAALCPNAVSVRPPMAAEPEAGLARPKPPKHVEVTASPPGREALSSVEEMLASVLGTEDAKEKAGAAPLSIDGGAVVSLHPSDADAEIEAVASLLTEQVQEVEAKSPKPAEVKARRPLAPSARHHGKGGTPPAPPVQPKVTEAPKAEEGPNVTAAPKAVEAPRAEEAEERPTVVSVPKEPEPPAVATLAAATEPAAEGGKQAAFARTMPAPWSGAQSLSKEIMEAVASAPATEITAASLGFGSSPSASEAPVSLEVTSRDFVPASAEAEPAPAAAALPSPHPEVPKTTPAPEVSRTQRSAQSPEGLTEASRAASTGRRHAAGEPDVALTPPTRSTSPLVWVGLGLAVVGGAGFLAMRALRPLPPPEPERPQVVVVAPTAESPVASAAVPEPAAVASVAPSTAPTAAEAPSASGAAAEPSSLPSAAPPETPPAVASAPPPEAPAEANAAEPSAAELAALPKGQGLLYVASPLQTNVYVYGLLAGTTNQRIATKCGPRFVRLGTAPGAWQGEGVVHIVKCGGFTRVDMAP